jgi:diketogulonate reductase-like aldo/keto reductase
MFETQQNENRKLFRVQMEYVTLRSGAKMPLVGYGTYLVENATTINEAIQCGYRMFDTAAFYNNEWTVGDCLKRCKIAREKLFIVTKAWNDAVDGGPAAMRYSIAKSLQDLRCEYIDLFMIHWPVPGKVTLEVYGLLEEMVKTGKIRDIGLSNFTIEDYENLMKILRKDNKPHIWPSVVQLEVSPFLFRSKTIKYFQAHGIHVMSYRGLGTKYHAGVENDFVLSLAQKYGKHPAQILGRFLVQQNISHIPKTTNKERMIENKDVFSFKLLSEDVEDLKSLTKSAALQDFKQRYLTTRVKDTLMQFDPPKEVAFTLD